MAYLVSQARLNQPHAVWIGLPLVSKVICARVANWETNYTSIMWPKHIDHCKDLAPGNYDMHAGHN